MDNLTHSLVGALLGRMGLKRLTGAAMPTLILAANAPDIDVFFPIFSEEPGLVSHRGFTHGIGGLLVLPPLLTLLVLAWTRWRPAREAVRPWTVLLLAFIGVLSHPILDFLTSYGTRLLEPFSDRWFYGDTLFIIDPIIWLAIIAALELSWRAEAQGRADWHRAPAGMFAALYAYIALNGWLTLQAREDASRQLQARGIHASMLAAVPRPIEFWKRRVLWQNAHSYGSGWWLPGGWLGWGPEGQSSRAELARLAAMRRLPDVSAFLYWARMPVVVEQDGRPYLADQRFLGRSRTPFLVPLDTAARSP